MSRSDVMMWSNVSSNLRAGTQSAYPVKYRGKRFAAFIDASSTNLFILTSYDDGVSWTEITSVKTAVSSQVSVWFDQWTPGDTGTLMHLFYADTDNDDVFHRTFDVSSESIGTEHTVFAGASGLGNNASTCISGAKMRGGNLICMFDIDGGTETGTYKSTDGGVNWSAISNTAEGGDYFLLAPGFASDNQDGLCIFWDRSASEISRKIYDDSADSWSETSISTSMTSVASTTCSPQFALTVDPTNSRLVVAAWNSRDLSTSDLKVWWVTESAITAKTDIVTDSDDTQMVALGLNTDTSYLYAFYGGKSDGSETVGTSINIYYKISTDSAATWGGEIQLTSAVRNYDMLYAAPVFTGDFACEFMETKATPAVRALRYSAILLGGPMVGGRLVKS